MRRPRAKPAIVTSGAGSISNGAEDDITSAWREMRADETMQFEPLATPMPDPPPDWLVDLGRFLERIFSAVVDFFGATWPVMKWVLLALAIAAALALIVHTVRSWAGSDKRLGPAQWAPQREEALALLEEADRLAAEGRYDEATRLLLHRSVGQIRAAHPSWLEPASTAREIATLPGLTERARSAFAIIAQRVERSLFALRPLAQADWTSARGAYADFALALPEAKAR